MIFHLILACPFPLYYGKTPMGSVDGAGYFFPNIVYLYA
jgi:hypothetical protein